MSDFREKFVTKPNFFIIIAILAVSVAAIFYGVNKLKTEPLPSDLAEHISSKKDLIELFEPEPFDVITSPLTIKGIARGTWFFEASFPIVLVDWDGRIIAQWYATALDEWMTEDFVPFEGTLEFETPQNISDPEGEPSAPYGVNFSRRGALILQKDNPSGLPEYDDALEIPVYFWP